MRAFIFALALTFSIGVTGCQSEQADAIDDRGDEYEDATDGTALEEQGDQFEEAMDDRADAVDEMIEDGAPMGDQEDVIGDGEIIDEPGEPEM